MSNQIKSSSQGNILYHNYNAMNKFACTNSAILLLQSVTLQGISLLLSSIFNVPFIVERKKYGSRDVLIHMHVVIRRIDITAKISRVPADCFTSISGHRNNTQWRKAPASVPWWLGPKKEHQITLNWDDAILFPETKHFSHSFSYFSSLFLSFFSESQVLSDAEVI